MSAPLAPPRVNQHSHTRRSGWDNRWASSACATAQLFARRHRELTTWTKRCGQRSGGPGAGSRPSLSLFSPCSCSASWWGPSSDGTRGCYSIGRVYFSARNHLRRGSPCWRRRGTIGNDMPYIITEACKNTKDRACVDVCPVDCIYEGPDQLYIHPDECIDCGACEPECPVTAIFPEEDVPANLKEFVQINREVFKSPNPPGRPNR